MAIVRDAEAGMRAVVRGATVLQVRDPGATGRSVEKEVRRLIPTAPVPVIVSSRIDVALATGAYGVHLPELDVPVSEARRLLPKSLIGRSVHSREAAFEAEQQGADYLIFGPVFASPSHPGHEPAGLEALREVAAAVRIPVLAIGGIDSQRSVACREVGAAGFAAIGYFENP
jgi:thiamine-phosphate diphosphorylase